MNEVQTAVSRTSIALTFSKSFESLLLAYPSNHVSLTADLELHIRRGLDLLEELEDVHDLQHTEVIGSLVNRTSYYLQMQSSYFKSWQISIADDLLDEIDLLILTHGDDLAALGLQNCSQGAIAVLLAVASFTLKDPLLPVENTITHFKDKLKAALDSTKPKITS